MIDLNVAIMSELSKNPHGVTAIILKNMVNNNYKVNFKTRDDISKQLQNLKRRGLVKYNGSRWIIINQVNKKAAN